MDTSQKIRALCEYGGVGFAKTNGKIYLSLVIDGRTKFWDSADTIDEVVRLVYHSVTGK